MTTTIFDIYGSMSKNRIVLGPHKTAKLLFLLFM